MERAAQKMLAKKHAMMRASTPTKYPLLVLRAFGCVLLCKVIASSEAAMVEFAGLVE
jgi:hypothetical protein